MAENGVGGGGGYVSAPVRLIAASAFVTAAALTAADGTVEVSAFLAGGNFLVVLPGAAACTGRKYLVKKIDSSANAVGLADGSGGNIEGSASYSLAAQNQFVELQSDGAQWIVIGSNAVLPPSGNAGGVLSGHWPGECGVSGNAGFCGV